MQTRSGRVLNDEPGPRAAAGPIGKAAPQSRTNATEKRKPFENVGNTAAQRLGQPSKAAPLKALQPATVTTATTATISTSTATSKVLQSSIQPLRNNNVSQQAKELSVLTQPVVAPKIVHLELLDDDEEDDRLASDEAVDDELQDAEGLCNMSLEESMSASLLMDEPQRLLPEEVHIGLLPSQANPSALTEQRQLPDQVEDIDELDDEDPQCVVEYVNDIYQFLRVKEARFRLDANYMRKMQNDLTPGMRAILLDWLADVGLKFKLLNDTTHMTVMLVDRYLALKSNVPRKQLQLIGVACMLIASKYEEIYAPEVRDFEYICDGAFTKEQILQMEVHILNTLNFDICHPTPLHFLRRYSKAARSDSECHTLAKYLTELAAVHYESLVFAPSMLAAAAVLLARSMHPNGDDEPFTWNSTMRHYTGYTRQDLLPAVNAMIQWGRDVQGGSAKLTAVFRKYSKRFFGVAMIPFPEDEVFAQ